MQKFQIEVNSSTEIILVAGDQKAILEIVPVKYCGGFAIVIRNITNRVGICRNGEVQKTIIALQCDVECEFWTELHHIINDYDDEMEFHFDKADFESRMEKKFGKKSVR